LSKCQYKNFVALHKEIFEKKKIGKINFITKTRQYSTYIIGSFREQFAPLVVLNAGCSLDVYQNGFSVRVFTIAELPIFLRLMT
jgi:hypothetical protein